MHYRELFGELLFDATAHFPNTGKYTLAPLQDVGADALVCTDVEGIDYITLKEVQIFGAVRRARLRLGARRISSRLSRLATRNCRRGAS